MFRASRCCFALLTPGYRSNNFIVGLTNTHPILRAPVPWSYTLCGQYPGSVPNGATVSVQCVTAYQRGLRFRYVIVQFPLINDTMNFCELEVFAVGKLLYYKSVYMVTVLYMLYGICCVVQKSLTLKIVICGICHV